MRPAALPERIVGGFMLLMLLEFVVVHSSAFMGTILVGPLARGRKALAIVGLGGFYTLFVGAFSLMFRAAWPLLSFWGLTLNRLLSVLVRQAPSGDEQAFLTRSWAVSALFCLLSVGITVFLPLPRLGLTAEVVSQQHLPGSGLWVSQPHRVMAAGFLYFTAVGISELIGHRWMMVGPSPGQERRVPIP